MTTSPLSYLFLRFRWVFCQLEVLRHCFPTNLRDILEELPKSLDETYKRILKEINNANRVHAYRLLQCLMVASRPLQVEELAEMLVFDLSAGGIPKLNAGWRLEDQKEAVLSACSSLVSIVIENGFRIVQFSHFSVKEFLTSDRLATCMEEVSWFHIPIEPSHVIFAQACLRVLLCLDDRNDRDGVRAIPLYQYAAEYWFEHAQVGNVESQIKDAMDIFFDMNKPHFSAWVRTQGIQALQMLSKDEEPRAVPPTAAPLYFAAYGGFRGLVERMITKHPEQINQLGGYYGTPLHASVFGGHIEVAQLLHAHGADIISCSADSWTPLHVASQEGHVEIVKWLLKCGADVDSKEIDGLIALDLAVQNGHVEVSQILLARNAEVDSRDNHGCTPLIIASMNGHPGVVRLLLDHNADADACNSSGVTPLHFAATYGHVEVSRILVERIADVNSRDKDGYTPLMHASRNGHPDLVRLLLEHNADLYVRDNNGYTPLHCAAYSGQLEVARLLLQLNVDVNSRTIHRSTPLLIASECGTPDLVQLLLDHNADLYVRDNDGDTPLHCAAIGGRLDVARFLLELSVDVSSRNEEGSTPLHLASAGSSRGEQVGYPDVVRLLLDHGADAQARNLSGETASDVARGPKQEEIVQILSQHAAE